MSDKIAIKLLINTETNRVLFAEAQKDFVDFFFSLLAIPVGTIVQLLGKEKEGGMVSSIDKIHSSLQSLGATYLQPNFRKESLLDPAFQRLQGCFLLKGGDASSSSSSSSSRSTNKRCYYCGYCHVTVSGVTDTLGIACPKCHRNMDILLDFIDGAGGNASGDNSLGVVKEVITYMVMDDLAVAPMSTISSITLLNKFHVKEVGSLEERVVDFGPSEGLKLLKASLMSTTVISDVFLVEKQNPEPKSGRKTSQA